MKDITIIVPFDKYNKEVATLTEKAMNSINEKCDIIFVGPKNVISALESSAKYKGVVYVPNEDINFCVQINEAIKKCKTKYFSILEYDDVYTSVWFKNFDFYKEKYADASIYLPLNEICDFTIEGEDNVIGFANEAVWASSFSEKLGYFDEESVKNSMEVACSGGIFETEVFKEVGGLKESMKLAFWLEFILRVLHKNKNVFVIPKVGYQHFVNRPDSLTARLQETMSGDEADWWYNLAKEEYFFTKDRKKTYEE